MANYNEIFDAKNIYHLNIFKYSNYVKIDPSLFFENVYGDDFAYYRDYFITEKHTSDGIDFTNFPFGHPYESLNNFDLFKNCVYSVSLISKELHKKIIECMDKADKSMNSNNTIGDKEAKALMEFENLYYEVSETQVAISDKHIKYIVSAMTNLINSFGVMRTGSYSYSDMASYCTSMLSTKIREPFNNTKIISKIDILAMDANIAKSVKPGMIEYFENEKPKYMKLGKFIKKNFPDYPDILITPIVEAV